MVTWDEFRKADTSKMSQNEKIALFMQTLADNAVVLGPADKRRVWRKEEEEKE